MSGGGACAPARVSGGTPASGACAALAALALLALAAQPQADIAPHGGWRLAIGIERAERAMRRWVLRLPAPADGAAPDAPALAFGPGGAAGERHHDALEAVRSGAATVPRLLLERLPPALRETEAGELRKRLFIEAMLPALLAENERVLERRAQLAGLFAAARAGRELVDAERLWLERTAQSYGVPAADEAELMRRIDAVPPSLALAQAALESGWGTSRGAQKAHSMFGHMRPAADPARAVLRGFDSMAEAIAAYVHNLNTHRAYAPLRETRAQQRARNQEADGHALAGALLRYSERGDSYVRDVRALIRANRLDGFDRARLGG